LRCAYLETNKVAAARRKTESNNREKTLKSGRVSRRVVVSGVGDEGREMSEVRR